MLQHLYVKNLALIDEIEVEFQKGLNILTGETGAGKSIILGSINLALGGRYSSDILRNEEEPAYVELTFYVENEAQIEQLKSMHIFPEDLSVQETSYSDRTHIPVLFAFRQVLGSAIPCPL
jgi:DNA repair protein RecN (Recombination protein N)